MKDWMVVLIIGLLFWSGVGLYHLLSGPVSGCFKTEDGYVICKLEDNNVISIWNTIIPNQ